MNKRLRTIREWFNGNKIVWLVHFSCAWSRQKTWTKVKAIFVSGEVNSGSYRECSRTIWLLALSVKAKELLKKQALFTRRFGWTNVDGFGSKKELVISV